MKTAATDVDLLAGFIDRLALFLTARQPAPPRPPARPAAASPKVQLRQLRADMAKDRRDLESLAGRPIGRFDPGALAARMRMLALSNPTWTADEVSRLAAEPHPPVRHPAQPDHRALASAMKRLRREQPDLPLGDLTRRAQREVAS